jgi:chorismate mutase
VFLHQHCILHETWTCDIKLNRMLRLNGTLRTLRWQSHVDLLWPSMAVNFIRMPIDSSVTSCGKFLNCHHNKNWSLRQPGILLLAVTWNVNSTFIHKVIRTANNQYDVILVDTVQYNMHINLILTSCIIHHEKKLLINLETQSVTTDLMHNRLATITEVCYSRSSSTRLRALDDIQLVRNWTTYNW